MKRCWSKVARFLVQLHLFLCGLARRINQAAEIIQENMCRRPLCSGGCVKKTLKQRNKATSTCTAEFMGLLRFSGNPGSSTVQWPTREMAHLHGHLVQLCNFIATVFLSLAANEKCKARQHARSERATELVQIEPRAPPKQAGSTKPRFKRTW